VKYIFATDGINTDIKASEKPYTHAVSYTDRQGRVEFSFHTSAALANKAAATAIAKWGSVINAVVETSLTTGFHYKQVKKNNAIRNWRHALDHIIAENNSGKCTCFNVEYHDRRTQHILLELARLGVDTKTIAL
jgi:hypothetical protein